MLYSVKWEHRYNTLAGKSTLTYECIINDTFKVFKHLHSNYLFYIACQLLTLYYDHDRRHFYLDNIKQIEMNRDVGIV